MATKRITKKQAAEISHMAEIVERLKEVYPESVCALEWGGQRGGEWDFLLRESWKLLVMGRLSAQCTDARVNIVCKDLFEKFPSVEAMADGDLVEIEAIVRPCGLYHTKAQNIKDACRILVEEHNGIVPDNMDALLALPGVGRKTANVVQAVAFGKAALAVDTHVFRVSHRLGLVPSSCKTPYSVEMALRKYIPEHLVASSHYWLLLHGRYTCVARKPKCEKCGLATLCKTFKKGEVLK